MTVKEAREEIQRLLKLQGNMCALFRYASDTDNSNVCREIEGKSELNDILGNVLSDAITIIKEKSKELNKRIENAEI